MNEFRSADGRLPTQYPWWVMSDSGSGMQLVAWYDFRDDAEAEVERRQKNGEHAVLRRKPGRSVQGD